MGILKIVLALIPLAVGPAQTEHVHQFAVQQLDECTGLSSDECCEWTARTAAFRATGDHLPEMAIRALKLSCADKERFATPAVCTGIGMGRRLPIKDLKVICDQKKGKAMCGENEHCKKCVAALAEIDYGNAHLVCHAVTFVKQSRGCGPKVIKLEKRDREATDAGQPAHVIKRRQQLR